MRIIAISIAILYFGLLANAKDAPFSNGVNLTNWFQAGSAQQIQFSKYSKTDFEQIKSLGCDVVRLPINLHFMTNGAPDYTLDPLFLTFLDEVINWTEDLGLHLILDNHTFDSAVDTDPKIGDILLKVWPQMAEHYLNTSEKIYYEILNEPHGISDALWNTIQQEVIAAIRKIDTKHTLIVGPASWNSYNNLSKMPVYNDQNLIYTFHFYDPFIFTHQGADWTDMTDLKGIPFPYSSDKMPEYPASMSGHWAKNSYNNYDKEGTEEAVYKLIDIAINFANERDVPIFCGEFGVFDVSSPTEDRAYWYKVVRQYLEANNVAWTIWDYHGGFGLFKKGGSGMFYHDLNVPLCEALGFTAPEQTQFIPKADSVGFEIFTDYLGKNINNESYGNGELSFYSETNPNNGKYSIQWSKASQYQAIVFDFKPNKDLSALVANGYALDMIIRGSDPIGSLDIRFIDSKTGENDHPWRNRIILNKDMIDLNGQWQHIHVPLSEFKEHGSWDNSWYNAVGLFDWTDIDKLEIVTEGQPMSAKDVFGFDNIIITNQDTATVKYFEIPVDTTGNKVKDSKSHLIGIRYGQDRQIVINNTGDYEIEFRLVDGTGRTIIHDHFRDVYVINTTSMKKGIYYLQVHNKNNSGMVKKLLIQ